MESVDVASVAVRAAAFVASLQAAGLFMFSFAAGKAAWIRTAPRQRLLRITALLAVVIVVAHRFLDGGRLAGDWTGIIDAGLQRMLWFRRPGLASGVCAAGLVALVAGASLRARWHTGLACLGTLSVIGSFALTGHTTEARHAGVLGALLTVHVALVAFWLGGVAGLRWMSTRVAASELAHAAERFSRAAVWTVPLILPAGLMMIWGLIPDLQALVTPYGGFLLAKLVGFCALIVLAGVNRLRLVPAISRGSSTAVGAFRLILALEYGMLAVVLVATATMTALFSWA